MTKNQNLGLQCKNAKRERCFGAIKRHEFLFYISLFVVALRFLYMYH